MEPLWDAGLIDEYFTNLKFSDFSLLLGEESNTAALILLDSALKLPGSASGPMQIRVEMAILLSQGLNCVLDIPEDKDIDAFIAERIQEGDLHIATEAYRGRL